MEVDIVIDKITDCLIDTRTGEDDGIHDIAYYAQDSRLTEPSDGKRYQWREMIELSKKLGRPLTDEEAENFRVD